MNRRPININETQKTLIRGLINHLMKEVASFHAYELIPVLKAVINPHLSDKEWEKVETPEIRMKLSFLRDIVMHPFPQNMSENDYSIDPAAHLDWVTYTNSQGKRIMEPKGLLNLTASNDTSAPSITKEAALDYIQICMTEKIAIKRRQLDYRANTYLPHLSNDNQVLNLSSIKIGYKEWPYLCHFLHQNTQIKYLSLNLSVDRIDILEFNDCFLPMNLIALEISNNCSYGVNITTAIGSVFQNLTHLSICDNIDDEGVYSIVQSIGANTRLVSFKIDSRNIMCWDYVNLIETRVRSLEIDMIQRTDCIVELSKILAHQPDLTNLSLTGGLMDDIGMEALSDAITSSDINLSTLEIYGDRMTNRSAFAIAHLIKKSSNMLSVTIHGTLIKNEGAIAIAHAVACHANCASFSIFGHYIDDAGAIGIAKALSKHPYLSLLKVGGNDLGLGCYYNQDGAKALVSHPNIDSVMMVNNYKGLSDSVKNILNEPDPIRRTNYGLEIVDLKPMAPLLQKMCLFALEKKQKKPISNQEELDHPTPS